MVILGSQKCTAVIELREQRLRNWETSTVNLGSKSKGRPSRTSTLFSRPFCVSKFFTGNIGSEHETALAS